MFEQGHSGRWDTTKVLLSELFVVVVSDNFLSKIVDWCGSVLEKLIVAYHMVLQWDYILHRAPVKTISDVTKYFNFLPRSNWQNRVTNLALTQM